MAAVTVEDCLKIVPNRFELSLITSYRAKQLTNGAPTLYVSDKPEKNTVIALREIAAGLLDLDAIRQEIKENIKNHALFKNFDDNVVYDSKKSDDSEFDETNLSDETSDNFDDSNDEYEDDDEEEYYKNLDNDLSDDDLEDELEK